MRAMGIILAGGNSHRMKELAQNRAISAMPIAGSYRAIDFSLSSMSNSGIHNVCVLTQYNARSLNRHLSSSKWWDFGRKQGGLSVLTPVITADNSSWYRGTADAMYQSLWNIKQSHEPYVVIASGDIVYKMDFDKLLEYHIEKKADITVVSKQLDKIDEIDRFGIIQTDEENRVIDFEEKPIEAKSREVFCGIYIIRRRLLIELLEHCNSENKYDFVQEVLIRQLKQRKICAYKIDDYWANISSVSGYFQTNIDFLSKEVRDYFFKEYPSVYSKVDDLAPAKYNPGCVVNNSLVASGCIINGTVEHSMIFKKVYVGNNVTIKNSIILNDVYIGDNTHIENCIVESRDTICANSTLIGEGKIKLVMNSNDSHV